VRKSTQAEIEGCILGLYEFRKHVTKEREHKDIEEYLIVNPDELKTKEIETAINNALITAGAVNLQRDMVNQPGNFMTPANMADIAQKMAQENGLEYTVFDKDKMKELGMGALLGVSQGSIQPPKFIILRYKGGGSGNIGLVGKGITFDSGGISIKQAESMGEMKTDMAGGASVIAAMYAISRLKPKVNVTALIPATENMPSGSSYKPGDVLTAMNGKTIEIDSTDAEGRLILADALSYATKKGLSPIVDVATLTGAIMRTFANITTGVMGNDQTVINRIIMAGEDAGEKMWQLPLFAEYRELNKSEVADIKNSGGQRAGSITAAFFLSEFVGDTPWVHLDIAGTVRSDKNKGYLVKGASGVPVRTLINFVLSQSE
jgi:leucyl aminopeptidase